MKPRSSKSRSVVVISCRFTFGEYPNSYDTFTCMPKGETVKRIEVRAKSKATVRVETPAAPQEIVVNDGSVPESETKDNVFKVAPPQS